MPILPDRKKMITTIIAGISPKHDMEEKEVGDNEQDFEPGLDAAVDDIFSAIETKDRSLMKAALRDFHALVDEERESEEPGEEEEESESMFNR